MRCASYCTADSYEIKSFADKLIQKGFEPKFFDDVIYIQRKFKENNLVDIFFFPFGCFCIWGSQEVEDRIILEELIEFEVDSLENAVSEVNYYVYNKEENSKTYINEEENQLYLENNSELIKLSASYGFAQSVKLEIFEKSVLNLIKEIEPLKQELALKGYVSLSKNDLSLKIGMMFSVRYSINLHNDILDTPEFFWRRPRYEPIYLDTIEFQDLKTRQNILNHRLDVVHELYTMLSNELNFKHSTRLEWVIILLITIEVILGILHLR